MKVKTIVMALVALWTLPVLAADETKTQVAAQPADKAAPAAIAPEPLSAFLAGLLKTDRRINSAQSDLDKESLTAKAKMGEWYPNLKLTAWAGKEHTNNAGTTANTDLDPIEYDLAFTQLLWDFGKTSAAVRQADLKVDKKQNSLGSTRQQVMLEAATAYVNLYRALEVQSYAGRSEASLYSQLQMEQKKLEAGAGKASDVQQARSTLAGASARRARAQQAVQQAGNRFLNVFGRYPAQISGMRKPMLPDNLLPASMDDAIKVAMEHSPTLSNARVDMNVEREAVREERANSFLPKLELLHDYKHKDDVAGTSGLKVENTTKIQLTWDVDLGFSGRHKVAAAEFGVAKASSDLTDSERNVTELVRNAWQALDIAKRTKGYLDQQVDAGEKFLELARKEQQAGKRSLLDVLTGETAYMNALSDAASADSDILLSAYNLLNAMGVLNEDAVTRLPAAAKSAEAAGPEAVKTAALPN